MTSQQFFAKELRRWGPHSKMGTPLMQYRLSDQSIRFSRRWWWVVKERAWKNQGESRAPCCSLSVIRAANRFVWICHNHVEKSLQIPWHCWHLGLQFPPASKPVGLWYCNCSHIRCSHLLCHLRLLIPLPKNYSLTVSFLPPPPISSVPFSLLRMKRR